MKRQLPSLIVFFGPDGVGKSTQVQLLLRCFQSQRISRVWIRGGHSMAFILNNFLMRLGYYRTERVASGLVYKIFDPSLLPKLRPIWGFIEFISVLPWIILRVNLPRIFRYTVVAERYVVDTVVYLGYWLGPDFFRSYLAKILLNFIPQGSLLIHLDAETQVLIKRLYYDTATIDFIVFQKKIYGVLAKMLGAVTIDTSRFGIKEVFQQIIKILNIQQNN